MNSFSKISLIKLSSILCAASLCAQQDNPLPVEGEQVAQAVKPSETKLAGTIYLLSGDSISGTISQWDKDYLVVTSSDFVDPVKFATEKILTIELDDHGITDMGAGPNQDETTLIINNRNNQLGQNETIKGGFSNIDETHVTLNTTYAGEIKVLKKFITKMEIDSKKGYLYLGPNSIDEWQNNSIKQTWEYTNNSLIGGVTAGNIAQDLGTPDEATLSFDLSWKEDEYLTLYLFSSDHEQSDPDNYYKLELRRENCLITKYVDGRQVSHLSSERMLEMQNRFRIEPNRLRSSEKELHARYEIFMSKTKGEFHIFRNGTKLDKLIDSNPQANKFGSALHLISGDRTPIRIKNLSLSNWSGHIPSAVDAETFAKAKGEGERILLKNGDILLGKIGKIVEGLMTVETIYAPLRIPIIRMRSVDLTGSNLKEEPLMYESDVKCWFKDKGWIILKLISIEGNTLTAYHQALGEHKYNLNVFKRIDLQIYNKEANTKRLSDSW
jgi:hypothetical protein